MLKYFQPTTLTKKKKTKNSKTVCNTHLIIPIKIVANIL